MPHEETILLVENNPHVARSFEERFACDRATDGWDAIAKLESHDYSAIVIDTDVPSHSGYGVITYLREELGERLGNVVLITTATECDDVRRRVGPALAVVRREDAVAEVARLLEA